MTAFRLLRVFNDDRLRAYAGSKTRIGRNALPYFTGDTLADRLVRALAKERARRYVSPRQLGLEIERFLLHEPVEAGPPGIGYRLRKWARRNAALVGVVSLLTLAALGSGITWWVFEQQAREAERRATLVWLAPTVEVLLEDSNEFGSAYPDLLLLSAWLERVDEADRGVREGVRVVGDEILHHGRERAT